MLIKKNIRRILSVTIWAACCVGSLVLLIAAVDSRKAATCRGYDIDINGAIDGQWFVDKNDIVAVLTGRGSTTVRGRKTASFDLNRLEAELQKEIWIKDAELYFDNNGVLKVNVKEREPIARIFSRSGESFYVDTSGMRLPLSSKMSARLPVFTGFPGNGRKVRSAADKKLVNDIRELSLFLKADPFWMAQVSQIDITPTREFELIPTVGNHVIEFGDGANHEKKFHRLFIFYRQVLAKAGMDKYERIKVQYDRQVLGVKKNGTAGQNTRYENVDAQTH